MNRTVVALTPENGILRDALFERNYRWKLDLHKLKPYLFRPCEVRLLLVTDGSLDFSTDTFGLSTVISVLDQPPGPYVRFHITVGHRSPFVTDAAVAVGNPAVKRSIKGIRFDDTSHFKPDMYDEVWLFGFNSSFGAGDELAGWSGAPTPAELKSLCQFMDQGGGMFATGDHGGLGSALCGHLPRARTMRRWFASSGPFGNPAAPDMNSPQRNDTNRIGHDADWEFDDQSDDIPQPLNVKYYSRRINLWKKAKWPHPLLCGPMGVIDVLPDHPHEGECVPPYETGRSFTFNGFTITEWPNAADGSGQVLPEVIATSTVLGGNDVKLPTVPQSFGAISAYDGERAGVGRLVCDATWHHFVNINLVGDPSSDPVTDPEKQLGFLASAAGETAFEKIKAYYRNIAVWLAPPSKRKCMRNGGIWWSIWSHQLVEAVTDGRPFKLVQEDLGLVLAIGRHARDVLGKYASQCQKEIWCLDLIRPLIPVEIFEIVDPWPPPIRLPRPRPIPEPDPVPWFDPEPTLDLALGGAIIAVREAFPEPDPAMGEKAESAMDELLQSGAKLALERAGASLKVASKRLTTLTRALG